MLDTACVSLFPQELPRSHHRRDRPRGGDHRADPLPALRVEARPLSRLPGRGLAAVPRVLTGSARDEPGGLPRLDRRRLHGQAGEAAPRRPLDPRAHRGLRGCGDRQGPPGADPRGARVLRRCDPARPGPRGREPRSAIRSPRPGCSWRAASSRRSTTGWAACSAATSTGSGPRAAPGCSRTAEPTIAAVDPRLRLGGPTGSSEDSLAWLTLRYRFCMASGLRA